MGNSNLMVPGVEKRLKHGFFEKSEKKNRNFQNLVDFPGIRNECWVSKKQSNVHGHIMKNDENPWKYNENTENPWKYIKNNNKKIKMMKTAYQGGEPNFGSILY